MPEEVVLRHPDLPNQPIIGHVGPDGTVSPDYSASGWVIDLDTDPAVAKHERPAPRQQPAPSAPHFAAPPEPTEPPAPAPEPAPESTEQGETSLDITKE